MKTLLRNFDILTTSKSSPIKGGSLLVNGGRIVEVLETRSPVPEEGIERVIEGRGRLLIPGFVNSHTHLGMTLFRGFAEDLNLEDWLEKWIWPAEENLTPEEVYWGSALAAVESIKAGVTTVADMYFHMDQTAQALEDSGLRALISYGIIAPEMSSGGEEEVKTGLALVDDWDGAAEGRINAALSPHAPYTCGDDVLTELSKAAEEKGVPIHTHLSETRDEVDRSVENFGLSPVARVEKLGLLENEVMAAHCVHVDEKDIEILADYRVLSLHNPTSNAKLASGIAPVAKMSTEGVDVGLATDGAASNNDLGMIKEMKLAAMLSKVSNGDPESLPVEAVYRMAVAEDVDGFGLGKLGKIEEGFKADLIAVDRNSSRWIPEYDPLSNLVYSGKSADVDMVMIDGKVVMEEGKVTTIDEVEVIEKVREIATKYGRIRQSKLSNTT